MGMKGDWIEYMNGWSRDDTCCLYIVAMPPVHVEVEEFVFPQDGGWFIVARRVPDYKPKHVAGPFPTLDGAKAAYIVLAPRYPGP